MTVVLIAIGCGIVAVLYGILTSSQVLRASAGNERMVAVSAAIQEGAKAYLLRQYSTIGVVGIVVAVLVWIFLDRMGTPISAGGFVLARCLGLGRLHRHEHLGARHVRTPRRTSLTGPHHRVPRRCDHRPARRRLALLAISVFFYVLVGAGSRAQRPHRRRGARRPRLRRFADLDLRPSRRRHLHQGRRRRRARWQGRAGIPEDDPRNPAVIADNVGDNRLRRHGR